MQAISSIFPRINKWLIFIKREVYKAHREHPDENRLTICQQKPVVVLNRKARQDMHFLRAFLTGLNDTWVPLQPRHRLEPLIPEVLVHTDASGQVVVPDGCHGPSLGINIPTQPGVTPRAVAFPLPMEWLKSEDDEGILNHHNTLLLEGRNTRVATKLQIFITKYF